MSDYYPRAFELARTGQWEEAMKLYWQVHPARSANAAVSSTSTPGTSTINRTQWKYQEWLAGFNGGALRAPAAKLPGPIHEAAPRSLVASGPARTDSPDEEFVRGRVSP